jgi:hypothetical protein
MHEYIDDIRQAMLQDLKKASIAIMEKRGVKKTSDLIKSVEWQEKKDVMTLIANDYFEFVSTGRRSGIMPPPQDLIPWMKKVGITPTGKMTYAQLSFVIANSIKKNGIKAKTYITPIVDVSTDIIAEDIATEISDKLVDDLVIILEQNN